MTTKVDRIRKDLKGLKLEKVLMEFPIKHVGDGVFEIAPGTNCRIGARGAAYMNNRIRNRKGHFSKETLRFFSWRSFTSFVTNAQADQKAGWSFANESWDKVAAHMNDCVTTMKNAGIDKPIYAIIVNGVLRGIPTKNFDFFDNELILKQIEENALANTISSWNIGNEKFEVCFKVKSGQQNDGVLLSVCLTNGHAGFDALKLDTILRNNQYEYVIPKNFFADEITEDEEKPKKDVFTQRNRHMGWIEQVFKSIMELLDRVGELNFVQSLQGMKSLAFIKEIHRSVPQEIIDEKRVNEIIHFVTQQAGTRLKTGFDVFMEISNYSSTRGYSAAVDKILDPTLDRLFEQLKVK